ncbi:MAG TPA: hypothetical protein PKK06_04305 [Phycisphaerae bacterium]|nr:hypothetical protein [Phycisphaerae bacterium]HNU46188.1 hypothetical protein [Phycisphaerae bacterium]
MHTRLSKAILALTAIGAALVICPGAWALDYYALADPGTTKPPGGHWVLVAGNVNFSFPAGGGSIWFATTNRYVSTNQKSYTLTLTGNTQSLSVSGAWGYYDNGSSQSEAAYSGAHENNPERLIAYVTLTPQPDWEVVKISSDQAGVHSVSVSAASFCSDMDFSGSTWDSEGWWGPPGAGFHYPVVIAFPTNVAVDTSVIPTLIAPPETGTWQFSFVYTDPSGAPMPYGGVRWETAGAGLSEQVQYQSSLAVQGSAETTYLYYAYDATDSQWDMVRIEPPPGAVPAAGYWGLGILAVCLIGLGAVLVIRRHRTASEVTRAA